MKFTTQEIDFGHNGAKSYRIEMDLANPQRPMQRHIWTLADGRTETQDWIYAGQRTSADLLKCGYTVMGE